MASRTPNDLLGLIASGAQVEVRDEEWLVRSTHQTPSDGLRVRCLGRSPLVRDTEATFFTALDHIKPLRPDETRLVADDSPGFRRSRLHLEAVLAKTPVPATETALAVSQHRRPRDPRHRGDRGQGRRCARSRAGPAVRPPQGQRVHPTGHR